MRKLVLEKLLQNPVTEVAPAVEDSALAELAATVDRAERASPMCLA